MEGFGPPHRQAIEMKKTLLTLALLTLAGASYAQSSSTANQSSASQAVAQGSIQFSQSPADQHLTETVRNVSAPVLGAYASSFSQFNCGQTTQGGASVAGFSAAFGSSKDQRSCVFEVLAAELARQSTIDIVHAAALHQAAINARCLISREAQQAIEAAGLTCQTTIKEATESSVAVTHQEH
jgi:hypothetical protein